MLIHTHTQKRARSQTGQGLTEAAAQDAAGADSESPPVRPQDSPPRSLELYVLQSEEERGNAMKAYFILNLSEI